MHRGVIRCAPDARLATAARVMAAHRIHCVVAPTGEEPVEWGLVSDLDLVEAALAGELDELTVGTVAARCRLAVGAHEPLEAAAKLMREHRASHVLVVQPASGVAIGVVSTLDVADALAELTKQEA
jgi:CBS domain-containing protein